MAYRTKNKEIINLQDGVSRHKKILMFLSLIVLSLSALVIGSQAQPPSQKPTEITDKVPSGKPERIPLGGNQYKLVYKNKKGEIFKVEFYAGGRHRETINVRKIHANGNPAEVTILTGKKKDEKSEDIEVEVMQEVTYDQFKNELKSTVYKKFKDGVATEKDEFEQGKKPKTYTRKNGEWKLKEDD